MKRLALLTAVVLFAACAPKGEETTPAETATPAVTDSAAMTDSTTTDTTKTDSAAAPAAM